MKTVFFAPSDVSMPHPSPSTSTPMLILEDSAGVAIWVSEPCGLKHESQVVELNLKAPGGVPFALQAEDGRLFFAQPSRVNLERSWVRLGVEPDETLLLRPVLQTADLGLACEVCPEGGARISNGRFSVEVRVGEAAGEWSGFEIAGPVLRFRIGDGSWRGRTFFDSRRRVSKFRGEIVEEGPVRIVYETEVTFENGGTYSARVTVDAGQPFAVVEEDFSLGGGDQLIWDFSGSDLPRYFLALDSTAGYRSQPIAFHGELKLGRLAAWTQQSQHLDFLDGFALQFQNGTDVAGWVALEGGSWSGDKLNHMEAWTRRWLPGDPASRRDVPATAKMDSYPGWERVAARGVPVCEEHFNVEAWVGRGHRKFALVLTTLAEIEPSGDRNEEPLGAFENTPDRDRYRRQQSLLRKIQIQYGVMPLQEMLAMTFAWPQEVASSSFVFPNDVIGRHFDETLENAPRAAADAMMAYLEARVYGFWEGSGVAYTNPVGSRRVVPEMFRFEWLARKAVLSDAEKVRARAFFAFLMHLFASENYYTGDAAMLPSDAPDSTEPSLAGMANQNFYTDTINVFGAGAQVFFRHPNAAAWREKFIERWHRQLAFHVYPESGVWEESHTYYEHVLHTVLPTLLRRRADGVDDEFANAAMQRLVASSLKQVTPRDACIGGRRYMIAFGDHGPQPSLGLYRELAKAFAEVVPALAGQLGWMAREMGGESPVGIEPRAPALVTEVVQGLGVMFRTSENSGAENLLAFRSGCAWGHHHNDDGSIQLFARGRSLIVDSAFGNVQPNGKKVEANGHSRWSLRDALPVNYYWRFNRGWIVASDLAGSFPFATGFSPVYTVRGGALGAELLPRPVAHWRSVVQLGVSTFLIADRSDSPLPQVVRFHVAGEQVVTKQGQVMMDFPGGRLTLASVFSELPVHTSQDRAMGDKVEGEFVTTEVCFDTGSFSVFLVHVGDSANPVAITASAEVSEVAFEGRTVRIVRHSSELLWITDPQTGTRRVLNLEGNDEL